MVHNMKGCGSSVGGRTFQLVHNMKGYGSYNRRENISNGTPQERLW